MKTWTIFMVAVVVWICRASRADDLAYWAGEGSGFGVINLTNGQTTTLGSTVENLSGLGQTSDGTIYGFAQGDSGLWKVDPATVAAGGGATYIGGNPGGSFGFGSTSNGMLYGLEITDDVNFLLTTVDPNTGHATFLGATGLKYPPFGAPATFCLSVGSSTLYMFDYGELYSLNTTTGAATLIGSLGNRIQLDSMLYEDGRLYGIEVSPTFQVDTVDPLTGAVTPGPATDVKALGLVPTTVPEPSTSSLLGFAAPWLLRRRRRIRGIS